VLAPLLFLYQGFYVPMDSYDIGVAFFSIHPTTVTGNTLAMARVRGLQQKKFFCIL
jgi:hypothetical protein